MTPVPAPRPTLHWLATPETIAAAGAVLRDGGLVAFPTETVYGLGANARSGEAVAGIYGAKGRPRFNPLIAHVASLDAARAEAAFGPEALALAEAFWPGPLTLVLPGAERCGISELARAGLPSVALRVPSHTVARALIEAAGVPVAAPSANRSGRISPTRAAHLDDLDGRIDIILDGGPTVFGLESTIVACLEPGRARVLRPGAITRRDIERVLGTKLAAHDAGGPAIAPGMLASHYAPGARVRLAATGVEAGEAVLDFAGALRGQGRGAYLDLSPGGELREAAANLFGFLRQLDAVADRIAVAPIPGTDLGEAIVDRLARAAVPR